MSTDMSMDLGGLLERLSELLSSKLGVPRDESESGATFEELGLDSLILVEFALIIKKEFDVFIADDEIKDSFTLADAASLLAAKGVKV